MSKDYFFELQEKGFPAFFQEYMDSITDYGCNYLPEYLHTPRLKIIDDLYLSFEYIDTNGIQKKEKINKHVFNKLLVPEVSYRPYYLDFDDIGDNFMDCDTKVGEKVVYKFPKNGHDHDKEQCDKYLKVGEVYTVKYIEAGGWSSLVVLEEIGEEISFNTVMFANT